MKLYATKIHAIDPADGEMKTWCGPSIRAISPGMADLYCQENGLGYCEIDGQVISEIPCDENYKADFSKEITYPDLQLN